MLLICGARRPQVMEKMSRFRQLTRLFVVVVLPMLMTAADCAPRSIEKVLMVGGSEVIECKGLKRMAIGNPAVADVAAVSTREVVLTAKSPGKTVLHVWDASGRRTYDVEVQPAMPDMVKLCKEIEAQVNDPRISVRAVGNTPVLEGTVSSEAESSRAESIARAALGCSNVMNLIRVERPLDEVSAQTMETAAALKQALNDPRLNVRALPGCVVVVEGKVCKDSELAQINLLMNGWVKKGADGIGMGELAEKVTMVNAVEVDASTARQIMVRAQVVDINRNALKEFGLDWGRVVSSEGDVAGTVERNVEDQPWLIGQTGLSPVDIFGGGKISRFDPVGARIRALEQQNKAKVLSEPNLLVLDGQEANILVGGEIPIPIVQSAQAGGAVSITVEFKEFGVRLKILPNITGEDSMQLKIMPEVSALDFSNAVTFSGFRIPAFRTRRAETTVNVKSGQSLFIGGLLQNETAKLVKKIPVLGDLPVLGELFKSRSFVSSETELVFIITPQIVAPTVKAEGGSGGE